MTEIGPNDRGIVPVNRGPPLDTNAIRKKIPIDQLAAKQSEAKTLLSKVDSAISGDGENAQIIIGPAGAGKTTVLASVLTEIEETDDCPVYRRSMIDGDLDTMLRHIATSLTKDHADIVEPSSVFGSKNPGDVLMQLAGKSEFSLNNSLLELANNSDRPIIIGVDNIDGITDLDTLERLFELTANAENNRLILVATATTPKIFNYIDKVLRANLSSTQTEFDRYSRSELTAIGSKIATDLKITYTDPAIEKAAELTVVDRNANARHLRTIFREINQTHNSTTEPDLTVPTVKKTHEEIVEQTIGDVIQLIDDHPRYILEVVAEATDPDVGQPEVPVPKVYESYLSKVPDSDQPLKKPRVYQHLEALDTSCLVTLSSILNPKEDAAVTVKLAPPRETVLRNLN